MFVKQLAMDRSRRSALLLSALVLSGACACGSGGRRPCARETWSGQCKLHSVTKVEEREMPMPYVVYEAIYTPQTNEEYPQFTPSDVRLRFGAPALQEFALVDHLKRQEQVACRAPIAQSSCLPEQVTVDVQPFDAEKASATQAPSIVGCAAIDAASEQDRLARTRIEGAPVNERFTFGEGSATLSPDATNTARDVAKRLNDDPSLECMGLVGQTTPGEALSLAEARARAVKQLLVSLGVDSRRLMTIGAHASVANAGPKSQPPIDPESRRVSLRVLLQTTAKSSP